MLDDDIIMEAALPPSAPEPLRFRHPNDREAVLYRSADELKEHFLALEQSPVDAMLLALGQPLSQLLREQFGGPSALAGCEQRSNASCMGKAVFCDQCGYWGDPGAQTISFAICQHSRSRSC